MAAVGDVFLHRPEPTSAFEHVRESFRACDVKFGNLEGVYSRTRERAPSAGVPVIADPGNADGVVAGGFNLMSLANNHSLDGGTGALIETRDLLRRGGIAVAGAGENIAAARRPAVVEVNGKRVALVAYASVFPCGYEARAGVPGLAPLRAHTHYSPWEQNEWNPGLLPRVRTIPDEQDLAALREDIGAARQYADIVLASFHWGDFTRPFVLTDHEVATARLAIDAGADAVLGHHHHLLRGVEIYRGKPVFYGLGHFAFDLPDMEERLNQAAYLGRGDARTRRESARRFGDHHIGPRAGYPLLPFHPDGRLTGFAVLDFDETGVRAGFVPCVLGPDNSPRPVSAHSAEGARVIDYVEQGCREEGLATRFERDDEKVGDAFVTRIRAAN
ncbi:CapA family protein [Streptomyces monticola]|uniref:CapA family protein n=1 Tax=Streptomyces monticola TaxID=2666263 RepID=A0ABW2JV31_9ACTN